MKQVKPGTGRLVLTGIALALMLFLVLIWPHAPKRIEPAYQGKTLTTWLKLLDNQQAFGISSSTLRAPTRRYVKQLTRFIA
jgi:hypothetical protein